MIFYQAYESPRGDDLGRPLADASEMNPVGNQKVGCGKKGLTREDQAATGLTRDARKSRAESGKGRNDDFAIRS